MKVLFALFAVFAFARQAHAEQEIYLGYGGLQYLVLEQAPNDVTKVIATNMVYDSSSTELTAHRSGDTLQLVEKTSFEPGSEPWIIQMNFRRSRTTPADYDYLGQKYSWQEKDGGKFVHPVAMLHRVYEPLVILYFRGAEEVNKNNSAVTTDSLVQLARQMSDTHPHDLYFRILLFDALIRKAAFAELATRVNESATLFANASDQLLKLSLGKVRNAIRWHELETSKRNGDTIVSQMFSRNTDLVARLQLVGTLLNYDEGLVKPSPIGDPAFGPDFLVRQVLAKIIRVEATFLLIQGKPEEALRLLAGSYRIGQFLNAEFPMIHRLIGVAIRSIAAAGLQEYALNACETEADFSRLWSVLADLKRVDLMANRLALNEATIASELNQDEGETLVRQNVADAKFELLRTATAARCHQVTTGNFPVAPDQFGPLLPDGPCTDPFTSHPLCFVVSEPYCCYSLGPDKKDQHGLVVYDPTNGTVSAGDLVTTIASARVYPFPRDPLKANTRDDVKHAFPNGLPVDPFADRKGQPLGVTRDAPIRIWSAGPDTDSSAIERIGDAYVPTIQYDPTNGAISKGDLFITLPGR